MSTTPQDAYRDGFKAGLACFAHWRDGEQLVGTGGTKLRDALDHVEDLHNYAAPPAYDNPQPSRPTAEEESPSYRAAMKDAGRGHLLP